MYNVYIMIKMSKNDDINNVLLVKYLLKENKNIYFNYIINKIKNIFYN